MKVQPGLILLAQHFWREPAYRRAVILITEVTWSGTKGIILNKQTSLNVNDVIANSLPSLRNPLFCGGVEDVENVTYVHTIPFLEDSENLGGGIYYNGEITKFEELINKGLVNANKLRFVVGNVEWETGKLEMEIATGMWWTGKLTATELFTTPPDLLWATILVKQGNRYAQFAEFFDPSLN